MSNKRAGRKSLSQTPSPIEDRIVGSSVNKEGSASSERSASSIKLSKAVIDVLTDKMQEYNAKNPENKVSLAVLKAVFRRGSGAYSRSHRPTISGGKPNSRTAWAYARVNKFLEKRSGKPVKKAYVQDDDLIDKYHLGGDMSKHLAPNGKPSNLTHEQWHLVRTPEFKAWFGDWEEAYKTGNYDGVSKVIDSNGEPLVMYHGTNYSFNVFSKTKYEGWYFFTADIEEAQNYGDHIIKVFLNCKNPNPNKLNIQDAITKKYLPQNFDSHFQGGWDISDFRIAIVKNPTQIKLADGTNTTFDGNNPDIRYKKGGEAPAFGTLEKSPYKGLSEEQVMKMDFPEIYKIAEKHKIGTKVVREEFIKGVFHEREHTSDWGLSAHTSLQHLWETPDYYTKLNSLKLAKGGKVNKNKGDCYQSSGRIVLNDGRGISFVGKPYLVHAEVRGQGELGNLRFGHAFIEDDKYVYDYSNDRELKIPKEFYYFLGDIKTTEPKYYRYTFTQARKKMLESGHFGSWELKTESGL